MSTITGSTSDMQIPQAAPPECLAWEGSPRPVPEGPGEIGPEVCTTRQRALLAPLAPGHSLASATQTLRRSMDCAQTCR